MIDGTEEEKLDLPAMPISIPVNVCVCVEGCVCEWRSECE